MVPFGRLPHLLEIEFLHARFVRRDGRALHADAVLLDGVGGVDGDLIAGLVAAFDAEIVVLEVHVDVGVDQLVLDQLPDDAGHLVAVEFDDSAGHLDLLHGESLRGGGFGRGRIWTLSISLTAPLRCNKMPKAVPLVSNYPPKPPSSRYRCSSGVDVRPRIAFRCGKSAEADDDLAVKVGIGLIKRIQRRGEGDRSVLVGKVLGMLEGR